LDEVISDVGVLKRDEVLRCEIKEIEEYFPAHGAVY